MEVNGQIHASMALFPGGGQNQFNRKLFGPENMWRRRKSSSLSGIDYLIVLSVA
jgi:hypothetical protein